MTSLLDVLLTFVGVMFVLALAVQSVQELLKAMFVFRGQAMRKALEGLITEAVTSQGLNQESATALMQELIRRLQVLGQKGWRDTSVRLDSLPADKLKELVATTDPTTIPSLQVDKLIAKGILKEVGLQAEKLYDLAVNPVTERYKRRMRVLALAVSAMVVIPLNVGAVKVWDAARTDAAFRQNVLSLVQAIDTLPTDAAGAADSIAAAGDSAAARRRTERRSLAQGTRALQSLADTSIFKLGFPSRGDWASFRWWVGILISIIFVSIGAPFWHDLLEMIFGLKNRARGKTEPQR
jgi:polyhydroxyalkanoate synthesis regulator phasin